MTDKELKRLSRSQLIDIINQLQEKQEELIAENARLSKALADQRPCESKTGNIVESAFGIQNVMQSAQNSAVHYLEEIRNIRHVTEERCRIFLEEAQKQADDILAQANSGTISCDAEQSDD